MAERRRITEFDVVTSLRAEFGADAGKMATALFRFAHANNLLLRSRHASVSVRIALGPSDRPGTLFVVPTSNRFYTYWLEHWPRRYQPVVARYAADLQQIFGGKRVIAPQGAKRNVVTLTDIADRWKPLQRAIYLAIEGIRRISESESAIVPESLIGLEGDFRRRMVNHRKREGRLRDARIAFVKNQTGKLACEIKGCAFDFESVYGEVGEDYAQVHHLRTLASRMTPSQTRVSELRVVCANCHAMIHRGGKSRSLAQIARSLRTAGQKRHANVDRKR